MAPCRPSRVSEYAAACIEAVSGARLGGAISLGGAFALLHFIDYRNIFQVCAAGLETPSGCWGLWRRRQELSGSDARPGRARLAVESHLGRIALHRPLAGIADPAARAEAEELRSWFGKEFLDALVD
jgi:hypothetical protein